MRKINEPECFKEVKDYYFVTECGRVYSNYGSGRYLKSSNTKDGYPQVVLQKKNGGSKTIQIHRLVYYVYSGDDVVRGMEVNHIDEDKTNNNYSNLECISKNDNINHGTAQKRRSASISGKNHHSYKPLSYYEENPILRRDFKKKCEKEGLDILEFEEIKFEKRGEGRSARWYNIYKHKVKVV